jgi:hypothetical protein
MANSTKCPSGWSSRSHFFGVGLLEDDGTFLECETHEPTFIGLSYTAYVLGIVVLLLCLWRILNSRPIVIFNIFNPAKSPAHRKRRDIQVVLFNTTVEMMCTIAFQTAFLFFDQMLLSSNFMVAVMIVYYIAICLDSFFFLRITVTTALLGVKAVESPFQERKTAILSRITEALHVVLFVVLVTGIVGVRVSATPEIQLAFARLFFAGSATQSIMITGFGYLHLSIIINALKEHSKTAKSHGLDGKHFKDVIERVRYPEGIIIDMNFTNLLVSCPRSVLQPLY